MTNDKVEAALKEIKELDAKKNAAMERLAALEGAPRVIDKSDQLAINANLQAIAEGRAVVLDTSKPKRELKPHEIDRDDKERINSHLREIAAGRLVVVDATSPY